MSSKPEKKPATDSKTILWTAAAKVRGLAELVSMVGGEPPMSEVAYKGLSYVLQGIADELDSILDQDG